MSEKDSKSLSGLGLQVVYRKPTKWRQFKGRVKSWFGGTNGAEECEQVQELPKIVITSPEDSTRGKSSSPSPLRDDKCANYKHQPDTAGDTDVRTENINGEDEAKNKNKKVIAEKEDLARAHQDVIAQMRESLLEARGGGNNNVPGLRDSFRKKEGGGDTVSKYIKSEKCESEPKTARESKPPVPPTKAIAVAKIRQTIAEARKESEIRSRRDSDSRKELENENDIDYNGTSDNSLDTTNSGIESKCESGDQSLHNRTAVTEAKTETDKNDAQVLSDEEKAAKAAKAAAARAKLRAALLSSISSGALANLSQENNILEGKNTLKINPKDENEQQNLNVKSKPEVYKKDKVGHPNDRGGRRSSSPGNFVTKKVNYQNLDVEGKRRASIGVNRKNSFQQSPQIIWQFFEEGKKKGVCKTCGYVVGTTHNLGGLTRHLSLVHQKEYRNYTTMMETAWTHGMMEKNLNMKVPKNI